jgi:hypothetical protein
MIDFDFEGGIVDIDEMLARPDRLDYCTEEEIHQMEVISQEVHNNNDSPL